MSVELYQPPATTVLCAHQGEIQIDFDDQGNAELTQSCWPDEDQIIRISHDNVQNFLDRLCDALGIMSVGGPE